MSAIIDNTSYRRCQACGTDLTNQTIILDAKDRILCKPCAEILNTPKTEQEDQKTEDPETENEEKPGE